MGAIFVTTHYYCYCYFKYHSSQLAKSPFLYPSLALIHLTCWSPNPSESRQQGGPKAPEKWPWVISGQVFAFTFRASVNFLRPLDGAEQRKSVFPLLIPGRCFLILPSTTTRKGRGRNSGEALNTNINYNS